MLGIFLGIRDITVIIQELRSLGAYILIGDRQKTSEEINDIISNSVSKNSLMRE